MAKKKVAPTMASAPAKTTVPDSADSTASTPSKTTVPDSAGSTASTPAPAKSTASAPVMNAVPSSSKRTVPTPSMITAPAPAKRTAPAPAKNAVPSSSKYKNPAKNKNKASSPSNSDEPSSSKTTAPSSSKDTVPVPAKDEASLPVKNMVSSPGKNAAAAPKWWQLQGLRNAVLTRVRVYGKAGDHTPGASRIPDTDGVERPAEEEPNMVEEAPTEGSTSTHDHEGQRENRRGNQSWMYDKLKKMTRQQDEVPPPLMIGNEVVTPDLVDRYADYCRYRRACPWGKTVCQVCVIESSMILATGS